MILAFFVLFFSFFIHTAYAEITITEINWKGVSGNQYAEWLELHNTGSESVNLSEYSIYKGGGSTLLFTLTKSIAGNGYLVVERTTSTSPDPLLSINDESGIFGGSGLSNSGEYLVIKNTSGSVVSSYDFSSGWPAGDSYTETMQFNGSSWVLGSPTPGSSFSGESSSSGSTTTSEETQTDSSTTSSKKEIIAPAVYTLSIKTKGEQFQASPISFFANVTNSYGKNFLSGIVVWNFGDGLRMAASVNEIITHSYLETGEYVVVAEYYRSSSFMDTPIVVGRKNISVGASSLIVSVNNNGDVLIKNGNGKEIDVSSWIVYSENKSFIIPKNTFILPGKTLVLNHLYTGFTQIDKNVSLYFSDNTLAVPPVPVKIVRSNQTQIKSDGNVSNNTTTQKPVLDSNLQQAQVVSAFEAVDQDNRKNGTNRIIPFIGMVALCLCAGAGIILYRQEKKEYEPSLYDIEILE